MNTTILNITLFTRNETQSKKNNLQNLSLNLITITTKENKQTNNLKKQQQSHKTSFTNLFSLL